MRVIVGIVKGYLLTQKRSTLSASSTSRHESDFGSFLSLGYIIIMSIMTTRIDTRRTNPIWAFSETLLQLQPSELRAPVGIPRGLYLALMATM